MTHLTSTLTGIQKTAKALVILPTLHERENLEPLIGAIFEYAPEVAVLVVDDNSRDGTKELLEDLAGRYPVFFLERTHEPGYGKSILDGMRWGIERDYSSIVTMDADFSHDPALIPVLVVTLQQYQIVIASRYIPGGKIENWSWYRRILSSFANTYVRAILGVHFYDATSGFVAYRREAVEYLLSRSLKSEGYAFAVECKYLLARAGFSIGERPLVFRDRREGKSKMSWRIIWESIWCPWQLRSRL